MTQRSEMATRVFGPLSLCFRSSVSIPTKLRGVEGIAFVLRFRFSNAN